MKTNNISFHYFILILIIKKINTENELYSFKNIVVIPFKTFYPTNDNHNIKSFSLDYYKLYHLSKLYLELDAGKNIKEKYLSKIIDINNSQILSLFLSFDDYLFYIDDNFDSSYNICRYSTEISTSYEITNSDNVVAGKTSFYGSDYFKIYTDLNKNHNKMIKMEFLYYKDKTKNISYSCGKVGFLFPSNKKSDLFKRNFINQIHDGINNIDYSFTLRYNIQNKDINDVNEGFLIIGIESYEKYINKNQNLISIYNKEDKYGNKQKWSFNIDNIFINKKDYQFEDIEITIQSDIEGFEFPKYIYIQLNEIYFNKYYNKSICKNEMFGNSYGYISIYCDEKKFNNNDISNFPEISLFKFELGINFTFSGEELFYKNNNKYFFKILFSSTSYKTEFKLGRLFLKKYPVIFNPDSKCMIFYKNSNKKEEKMRVKKNILTSTLFRLISISIIFLIVGLYIGRKFCILRRHKYANEMPDNNNLLELEIKENKKENKLIDI